MSLLCWSGGLDSTLVLHEIAAEHRDGRNAGLHKHGVRALTIHHTQVSMNEEAADAARAKLKKKFLKLGLTISYIDVTVKQDFVSWSGNQGIGAVDNPQAFLWLTTAVNYLQPDEDLYSGYIRGDDYWHKAGGYQAAFDALRAVSGLTGRLVHPLEWETKADVIRRTKELCLYDLCWWCEEQDLKPVRGKFRACGKCKSCLTNATGLWQLENQKPAT